MKRILVYTLILMLLPVLSLAGGYYYARPAASGSKCSSTGDIFSETFEASEYDNSNWVETQPANATVDGDNSGEGDIPSAGSKCLMIENIDSGSPTYSANDADVADNNTTIYFRVYFRLDSTGISSFDSGDYTDIINLNGTRWLYVRLKNDSGTYKLIFVYYDNTAYEYVETTPKTISTDTTYRIEIYANDDATPEWEFKVDGISIDDSTNSAYDGDTIQIDVDKIKLGIGVASSSGGPEIKVYFDCPDIDSSDWLGE